MTIDPKTGKLYVFWRVIADPTNGIPDAIYMNTSSDGGSSWANPTLVSSINPFDQGDDTGVSIRTRSFPTATVSVACRWHEPRSRGVGATQASTEQLPRCGRQRNPHRELRRADPDGHVRERRSHLDSLLGRRLDFGPAQSRQSGSRAPVYAGAELRRGQAGGGVVRPAPGRNDRPHGLHDGAVSVDAEFRRDPGPDRELRGGASRIRVQRVPRRCAGLFHTGQSASQRFEGQSRPRARPRERPRKAAHDRCLRRDSSSRGRTRLPVRPCVAVSVRGLEGDAAESGSGLPAQGHLCGATAAIPGQRSDCGGRHPGIHRRLPRCGSADHRPDAAGRGKRPRHLQVQLRERLWHLCQYQYAARLPPCVDRQPRRGSAFRRRLDPSHARLCDRRGPERLDRRPQQRLLQPGPGRLAQFESVHRAIYRGLARTRERQCEEAGFEQCARLCGGRAEPRRPRPARHGLSRVSPHDPAVQRDRELRSAAGRSGNARHDGIPAAPVVVVAHRLGAVVVAKRCNHRRHLVDRQRYRAAGHDGRQGLRSRPLRLSSRFRRWRSIRTRWRRSI